MHSDHPWAHTHIPSHKRQPETRPFRSPQAQVPPLDKPWHLNDSKGHK